MSKINQPPRGLQSFLGNVNQGQNPSDLDQAVRAGIDIEPFLQIDKIKGGIVSGSISKTIGQGLQVNVPPGFVWKVIAASFQSFVAIEQTLRLSLRIIDPSGGQMLVPIAEGISESGVSVGEIHAGILFSPVLILPTGWGLRGQIDMSDDASLASSELNYMYVPLQA